MLRQFVTVVYCNALGSGSAWTGLQVLCQLCLNVVAAAVQVVVVVVVVVYVSYKCPRPDEDGAMKGVRRAMSPLYARLLVSVKQLDKGHWMLLAPQRVHRRLRQRAQSHLRVTAHDGARRRGQSRDGGLMPALFSLALTLSSR
jgi:hypothetical protein